MGISSTLRFAPPGTRPLLVEVVLPILALLVVGGLFLWEPHIELAFYSRARVSPSYNVSEAVYGRKKTEVHSGVPMRLGMDCYDFAGTIKPESSRSHGHVLADDRVQYHTYWRTDLAPFGERQEWMLKSFFATQNTENTRLILWSNGDLSIDFDNLARGTALEGSELLRVHDTKAWIDGDLVRLLAIWTYGGVWVDMDSLLTRDLAPLLEHEFVTQWDCYDKKYVPFNGPSCTFTSTLHICARPSI
ncbi:hypothetical protein A0H81_12600 [Grifola frondosa]|uniref:Initiation-specific alpha-1,6-mannosyltransferase n=1 Tax=Grifola frondosa TaxID=5627 RepID=A0A1C7LRM2_GRIFR|nr:hypothetical protein A0H81_12600 [Grifola frondosa]